MQTDTILKELRERVFAPRFIQAIKEGYDADVAMGRYDDEEEKYSAALEELSEVLSPAKKKMLTQMIDYHEENRAHAAESAFVRGLVSGFEDYFAPTGKRPFSYTRSIEDTFLKQGHRSSKDEPAEHENTGYKLACALSEGLDDVAAEHMAVIEGVLEERIHHAVLHGFYAGYRSAIQAVDEVCPHARFSMMEKLLLTEYQLGFTDSYAKREQVLARKRKGA